MFLSLVLHYGSFLESKYTIHMFSWLTHSSEISCLEVSGVFSFLEPSLTKSIVLGLMECGAPEVSILRVA